MQGKLYIAGSFLKLVWFRKKSKLDPVKKHEGGNKLTMAEHKYNLRQREPKVSLGKFQDASFITSVDPPSIDQRSIARKKKKIIVDESGSESDDYPILQKQVKESKPKGPVTRSKKRAIKEVRDDDESLDIEPEDAGRDSISLGSSDTFSAVPDDLASNESFVTDEIDSIVDCNLDTDLNDEGILEAIEKKKKVDEILEINRHQIAKNIFASIEESIKPDVRSRALDQISESLQHISSVRLSEYADPKPKDEKWKLGLSPAEVEELTPALLSARRSIEEEEPTMQKILSCAMTLEDRKGLIQLFDIYQSLEPYTEDYLSLRTKLVSKLKVHMKSDEHRVLSLEREERLLGGGGSANQPLNTRERILELDAPRDVKATLLGMYEEIKDSYNAEVSQALRRKIEFALELPYEKLATLTLEFPARNASDDEKAAFCATIRSRLDEELYGMDVVKDELISILNARINNPRAKSSIALKEILAWERLPSFKLLQRR